MIGPVKVPEGVKITAIWYCDLITDILSDWLYELPLSAPAHADKLTTELLSSMRFKGHFDEVDSLLLEFVINRKLVEQYKKNRLPEIQNGAQ